MEGTELEKQAQVINGMVTSFEVGKGYGFVADGGGRELFVPPNDVQHHGPKLFTVGQRVRFEVFQAQAGPQVVALRKF